MLIQGKKSNYVVIGYYISRTYSSKQGVNNNNITPAETFNYTTLHMAGNILGVDWGTKYIGFAYRNEKSDMVMPIGYLMNDKSLFFDVGDILGRYHIKKVVVGYPKQHKETQVKIDEFLKNITFVDRDIVCEKVDEEYSSVMANATTGTYKKDETEDTLAAIHILEGYMKNR